MELLFNLRIGEVRILLKHELDVVKLSNRNRSEILKRIPLLIPKNDGHQRMINEDYGPEIRDGFYHFSALGIIRLSEFVVLMFHLKDLRRSLLRQTVGRAIEYIISQIISCS